MSRFATTLTAKDTEIQAYFDGLCQPCNPGGIACFAFAIFAKGLRQYYEYGLAAEPFTDDATNNLAEYSGLIKALEWLLENKYNNQKIIVRGDSQLVIKQLNSKWKVRAPTLIPLHQKAITLLPKFKDIKIEWIPRDKNKEADKLSNSAYQEVLENDPGLLQKSSQHMATDEQLKILTDQGIKPEKYLSKIEARRLISKYRRDFELSSRVSP
jgi:ribonuclease HI